jgi:hypothetical protein
MRKSRRLQVRDVVGAVLLGAIAVVLVAQVAASGDRPSTARRARLCAGVRNAGEHLAHEHPEHADKFAAAADAACDSGFPEAPAGAPSVAGSSTGCARQDGGPVSPIRHRAVAAPARPVPFFAARAGDLPKDGVATVAGVVLPSGSRCPHYWATDAPVPDAVALAGRLARAFPKTGLWPVLWDWEEDPDDFALASGDPRDADRLSAEKVLAGVWDGFADRGRFPGLAAGSTGPTTGDPFQALAASDTLEASTGQVLVLVPANRPADAVAVLGTIQTEVLSDRQFTTVLRSWEERFGAVVTMVGPDVLGLSVGRPPRDLGQARRLVAEQDAFAPEDGDGLDTDDARALLQGATGGRSRDFWRFGWPD